MWEMFHLGSAEPYGDKKDMIDVKRLVNLINIFTGSPSWNSHDHDQTIHTNENFISMNLFKIICVVYIQSTLFIHMN